MPRAEDSRRATSLKYNGEIVLLATRRCGIWSRPGIKRRLNATVLWRIMLPRAVLSGKLAVDIRPELLQDVRRHVRAELHTEFGDGIGGRPVIRIVRGRNGHCGRIANNFREIELHAIRIRVSPEDLAGRARQARPGTARPP